MPKSDAALLRESYGAAEKRLREAHPDEFNKYRQEEAQERGLSWTPPKSKLDKARDTLREVFAEHPDLLTEIQTARPQPTAADLPDLPPED